MSQENITPFMNSSLLPCPPWNQLCEPSLEYNFNGTNGMKGYGGLP